jgi:hypothetical protein
VYLDRVSELQARVDRRRVRIAHASAGETREAVTALCTFMAETARLDAPDREVVAALDLVCEPVAAEDA